MSRGRATTLSLLFLLGLSCLLDGIMAMDDDPPVHAVVEATGDSEVPAENELETDPVRTVCTSSNALCVGVRTNPNIAAGQENTEDEFIKCEKNILMKDGHYALCGRDALERQGHIEYKKDAMVGSAQFDAVFTAASTNADVYDHFGSDVVKKVFRGNNAAFFAYGSTGSGKTYTMGFEGASGMRQTSRGMLQLFLQGVKRENAAREAESKRPYVLEYSVYQIYAAEDTPNAYGIMANKKMVYDLCREDKEVLSTPVGSIPLPESSFHVLNEKTAEADVSRCFARRTTFDNGHNMHSSRSFAIVQLRIKKADHTNVSSVYFVDLAGTEDPNDYPVGVSNPETRRKEGISINLALMYLRQCFLELGKAKRMDCKKSSHPLINVLFNDLFHQKKRGAVWIRFLATIRMERSYLKPSIDTIKYAARLKELKIKPVISDVVDDDDEAVDINKLVERLKAQVEDLQEQLKGAHDEITALRANCGGDGAMRLLPPGPDGEDADPEDDEEEQDLVAMPTTPVRGEERLASPEVCGKILTMAPFVKYSEANIGFVSAFTRGEWSGPLLSTPVAPKNHDSAIQRFFLMGTHEKSVEDYKNALKLRSKAAGHYIELFEKWQESIFSLKEEIYSDLLDNGASRDEFCFQNLEYDLSLIVPYRAELLNHLHVLAGHYGIRQMPTTFQIVEPLIGIEKTTCHLWSVLGRALRTSAKGNMYFEYTNPCSGDQVVVTPTAGLAAVKKEEPAAIKNEPAAKNPVKVAAPEVQEMVDNSRKIVKERDDAVDTKASEADALKLMKGGN